MSIDIKRYINRTSEELNSNLIQMSWNLDFVKFLLTHPLLKDKIDINTKNELGQNALMLACCYNKIEVISYLLLSDDILIKPKLYEKDNEGRNILMYACQENFFEIAKFLIVNIDFQIDFKTMSWLNGSNKQKIIYIDVVSLIEKLNIHHKLSNQLELSNINNKVIKV